jgi:hypothetical protein
MQNTMPPTLNGAQPPPQQFGQNIPTVMVT